MNVPVGMGGSMVIVGLMEGCVEGRPGVIKPGIPLPA